MTEQPPTDGVQSRRRLLQTLGVSAIGASTFGVNATANQRNDSQSSGELDDRLSYSITVTRNGTLISTIVTLWNSSSSVRVPEVVLGVAGGDVVPEILDTESLEVPPNGTRSVRISGIPDKNATFGTVDINGKTVYSFELDDGDSGGGDGITVTEPAITQAGSRLRGSATLINTSPLRKRVDVTLKGIADSGSVSVLGSYEFGVDSSSERAVVIAETIGADTATAVLSVNGEQVASVDLDEDDEPGNPDGLVLANIEITEEGNELRSQVAITNPSESLRTGDVRLKQFDANQNPALVDSREVGVLPRETVSVELAGFRSDYAATAGLYVNGERVGSKEI